jgi:cytosine/uracil/thiamine/allantoin permease
LRLLGDAKAALDLEGLFDPQGPYSYGNGFNWRAIVTLVVAIAPVVPGFCARQPRRVVKSVIQTSSTASTLMHGSLLLPSDSSYTTF